MSHARSRRADRITIGMCIGVLALSAAAFAQDPGPGDPGWEYGRLNCGPLATPPVLTYAECIACCTSAEEQQVPLPPASWVVECKAYCEIVAWENWGE